MAAPPGLRQRGKSWEMRVRVPKLLHGLLPKERLRSFGAVSYKEACRRGWEARADIEREFEEAELKVGLAEKRLLSPIKKAFSEAELDEAARQYLREREANSPAVPLNADAQAEALEAVWDDAYHAGRPSMLDDAGFHALAADFAERQGYQLPIGPARYPLLKALQIALVEHYDRLEARLSGATVATINPGFAGVEPSAADQAGVTLAHAVEMYIAAPERSANADSSRKMDRSRLGTLRDVIGGDRLVGAITKADLRGYVDQLIRLPCNYAKLYPGMRPVDAIAAGQKAGVATLSATSIERGVQAAKSLFGWLQREDVNASNPARHLKAPKAPSKSRRRSFEPDEMMALLRVTAPADDGTRDWKYWLVRIGMLQGLRLTEPLGLEVRDLTRIDGVLAFRIRPNKYRALKTQETERDVPVHPRLVELGIARLVEGREAEARLIADAPWSQSTGFNAAQKQMGRIVRNEVSTDPNLTFHSLRHNFREAMLSGSFPRSVEQRLGGWKAESGSVMDTYGRGHRMQLLKQWIAGIAYPDVTIN